MMETRPRKLLDQVTDAMRLKHYAHKTVQSYVYWINRYILFHNNQHPVEMSRRGLVRAFVTIPLFLAAKGAG